MVNQLRTMLLNVSGANKPADDYPGEEYVPVEFSGLTYLAPELKLARSVLFGNDPDRAMINYRLREYMNLLHGSDLEPYVTALDSRITYWPTKSQDLFSGIRFGALIKTVVAHNGTWAITVIGDPKKIKRSNRLLEQWQVEVLSSSEVRTTHLLPDNETSDSAYSGEGGVANAISLPGSSMSYVLTVGNAPYPTWQIQHMARPALDLVGIYESLVGGLGLSVSSLLGYGVEPYLTCARLWDNPTVPIPMKIGAIVLALGYRMNAQYYNLS